MPTSSKPAPTSLSLLLVGLLLLLAAVACTRSGDNVLYITATPVLDANGNPILPPTITPDEGTLTLIQPTPNPVHGNVVPESGLYTVQAGDTLSIIAAQYGMTADELLAANELENPNVLEVGQQLNIPGGTEIYSPDNKLIPDSELVYGPAASSFSVAATVKYRQGFLKAYSEEVDGTLYSGVELVDMIAQWYSVNPRLLLALLEYRGNWLSNPYPTEEQLRYPMGIVKTGREGLYRQLWDAADALNTGYYGWKYRGLTMLAFTGGLRVLYAPGLNPGTVGVQYMLSLQNTAEQWQQDVHPNGFFAAYTALFGDPFALAVEPITPLNLTQPTLTLPFASGEEWVYTGGPHGAYNSGSAWGAVDFAPPKPSDELLTAQGSCYISPNWVTAAAPGIVARSGNGWVILDLDGDGNEHTGWTLIYLHIDDHERIAAGTKVEAGTQLGHPSCQGGVSTGTHLHFTRRYNGEWIPTACEQCAPYASVPSFVLGEWTFYGFTNNEYQGYMTRAGDDNYRQADASRDYQQNKVIW